MLCLGICTTAGSQPIASTDNIYYFSKYNSWLCTKPQSLFFFQLCTYYNSSVLYLKRLRNYISSPFPPDEALQWHAVYQRWELSLLPIVIKPFLFSQICCEYYKFSQLQKRFTEEKCRSRKKSTFCKTTTFNNYNTCHFVSYYFNNWPCYFNLQLL